MTHRYFDPDSINWTIVLKSQEGGGQYFIGTKYQRGYGVLGSIGRFLLPIAKNLAESIAKEGVATGTNVLKDIAEGKDLKRSLMTHAQGGISNIGEKIQQCGKGVGGKKRALKSVTKKKVKFTPYMGEYPTNKIGKQRFDQLGPLY